MASSEFSLTNPMMARLEVTESDVNINNNTSKVTATVKIWRSNEYTGQTWSSAVVKQLIIDNTIVYDATEEISHYKSEGEKTIMSGSKTITHNSDGSKSITVWCQLADQSGGYYTGGTTLTMSLSRITRGATIDIVTSFNDEMDPFIRYSNPAGSAVTSLQACIADTTGGIQYAPYRDISKAGGTYVFYLTASERNAMRAACPNSNTLPVVYYVKTEIGGTTIRAMSAATMTITNATPTVSSVTAVDVNSTTTALTGNSNTIVNGYSNLKVSGISASAYKYASLKSVIVDGVSATYTSSYTKTIYGYTKNNIGVRVVDSRSNTSSTFTKTLGFVDYFPITKGALEVNRSDSGIGEKVTLSLKGSWFNGSFGSVTNTLAVSYRYKKTTVGSWTTGVTPLTVTKSGNNFSINQEIRGDSSAGFNIDNAYNLEIIFTDKLSTTTFSTIIGSGSPAIAIKGNKIALGGKFDDSLGLDVQFKKCPFPIGYIYMSMSSTDPGTIFGGTWTRINGYFLYCTSTSKTTGGSTTTGSTTLTLSQVPSHYHDIRWESYTSNTGVTITRTGSGQQVLNVPGFEWSYNTKNAKSTGANLFTNAEGGGGGHTHSQNLPPYMTCYAWYRTA